MGGLFTQENISLLARIIGLLVAIPFHEVAHGFISDKLGDHTARDMGRLTMNPIKHLDIMGLISMLVIGVGWAKPVPVNPGAYKNPKKGMAITAAAGPLSNLLLAFATVVIYKLFYYVGFGFLVASGAAAIPMWFSVLAMIFQYFILININLALFNLLPIPPLDGSRIFSLFLPQNIYFKIMKYERYVMFALLIVVFILPRFTTFNPLGWYLGTVGGAVYDGFLWVTGFIDKLFYFISDIIF